MFLRTLSVILLSIPTSQADLPVAIDRANQSIRIYAESYSVRVPEGYTLELLTDKLDGPRLLSFSNNGDLFICS